LVFLPTVKLLNEHAHDVKRFSFGVEETFLGELSDISGGVFLFILICLVFSLSYLYKNICCRKNQKRELEDTSGSVNSTKDYECKILNEADHDSIEFIEQDDTHSNYICYYAFSGRLAVYDLATNSLIAQVNRVTVQRGIKKNDLKARAMQHHGLIYRQGQVSFQRSSPEREKNIRKNSSIQSEENDCSRVWDLKMSKKFVFTARSDGKLEKWSVGKRLEMVKCVYVAPSGITHLLLLDDDVICFSIDMQIIRLDSNLERTFSVKSGHSQALKVVRLVDKSLIVTGSMDGTVRVISTSDGRTNHLLRGHLYPISTLNLGEDGPDSKSCIMSCDESGEIRVWTLSSGRCQFVLRPRPRGPELETVRLVQSEAIANIWPTQNFLIALTMNGKLHVWTHRSGHFRHTLDLGRSSNGAGAIFHQHFLSVIVDQSIITIDIRQSRDKVKIEQKSLNSMKLSNSNSSRTPSSFILYNDEMKRAGFHTQLSAVVPHGSYLKRVNIPTKTH